MIRLQRVLLPTDFSEFAAPAGQYACTMAERFGAELHLLSVIERFVPLIAPEYGSDAWDEDYVARAELVAKERLDAFPGEPWRDRLSVLRAVRSGHPFLEILQYAEENEIDLIVMGTHGRTGMAHVLMGSVAERVIRKAPCPVLTIRPDGQRLMAADAADAPVP